MSNLSIFILVVAAGLVLEYVITLYVRTLKDRAFDDLVDLVQLTGNSPNGLFVRWDKLRREHYLGLSLGYVKISPEGCFELTGEGREEFRKMNEVEDNLEIIEQMGKDGF